MKRDKYDIVFSRLIRAMAGDQCEKCGRREGQLECAHIFGRRSKSTRWDLDNALCLCHSCHRHTTENPVLFFDWLRVYIGDDKLDELRLRAHSVKKWTQEEKDLMYKDLKERLKTYEN